MPICVFDVIPRSPSACAESGIRWACGVLAGTDFSASQAGGDCSAAEETISQVGIELDKSDERVM